MSLMAHELKKRCSEDIVVPSSKVAPVQGRDSDIYYEHDDGSPLNNNLEKLPSVIKELKLLRFLNA